MPQAMNLERELVSFFRQSRRRSWNKDQIIEAIHTAYIKQLEEETIKPSASTPAEPLNCESPSASRLSIPTPDARKGDT